MVFFSSGFDTTTLYILVYSMKVFTVTRFVQRIFKALGKVFCSMHEL